MHILPICIFIKQNDRNSDIMDMYKEFINDEIHFDTMIETLQRILGDWKECIETDGELTGEIKAYYDYLGI